MSYFRVARCRSFSKFAIVVFVLLPSTCPSNACSHSPTGYILPRVDPVHVEGSAVHMYFASLASNAPLLTLAVFRSCCKPPNVTSTAATSVCSLFSFSPASLRTSMSLSPKSSCTPGSSLTPQPLPCFALTTMHAFHPHSSLARPLSGLRFSADSIFFRFQRD